VQGSADPVRTDRTLDTRLTIQRTECGKLKMNSGSKTVALGRLATLIARARMRRNVGMPTEPLFPKDGLSGALSAHHIEMLALKKNPRGLLRAHHRPGRRRPKFVEHHW
jgi:hypothetical protein